ncbi:helix-turn-helix domain-containing protein [Bacillus nitratireducens]|uniref:helix-turn-helix domain-containing protein n=1 Tax=Bacillus nitratireducens TaxID=2026193 RepID=UPI00089D7DCB|nr:helix-turn-helix transcriptional regulator [Bacillus nitratireducens]SDZ84939.1 DNA-binding transcriptional regulator, XRE family [Bacillus nitratireducens]
MTIFFYVDLEDICKQYNITQTALAEEAGITQATLSRIKHTKSINMGTLSKIATALRIEHPEKLIKVMKG